jgi:hypothetical protein
MIRFYEQGLDWLISHTTIEMALILFIIGICGMIAWTIWIVAILRDGRKLNSDIEIWEAIKEAREPHHTRTNSR